jgi:DNA polymerase-4
MNTRSVWPVFFERDLTEWEQVVPVRCLGAKVWAACERGGHAGRTVTVKVKHVDFRQLTRSRSATEPVGSCGALERIALDLLRPCFPPPRGIR